MQKTLTKRAQLSTTKQALFKKRLQRKTMAKSSARTIARRKGGRPIPLSFAQQRLWFIENFEGGSSAYNIPFGFQMKGSLRPLLLEKSLNEIVKRHEILHTAFKNHDGRPLIVLRPELTISLPLKDLRKFPKEQRDEEIRRLLIEDSVKLFNLEECPLFRTMLLRVEKDEYVFFMTIHHIIFDGWSVRVFIKELAALYEAFSEGKVSPLAELPIQYTDFTLWQREWLYGGVLEEQLAYWNEKLKGKPAHLDIPADRPRPAVQTFQGKLLPVTIPRSLSEALKVLSQQEKCTLFMTLLAAFKILLYRYTGQEDILVGTAVANRTRHELEDLIGFFVNILVLRDDLSENPTFREFLKQIRETTLEAHDHQEMPFDLLVAELQHERDLSYHPLFQVMFVLQNVRQEDLSFSGLSLRRMEIDNGTVKFDLLLELSEKTQGLSGHFHYNSDLFDETTILRMKDHFLTLLEGIVKNPDQKLSDLPILTQQERHRILVEWNDTRVDYPKDKCLHELFEEQVDKIPKSPAVIYEAQMLSYYELNARANQLAHYLKSFGVGPDVLVGLCIERSIEMVVGLLGILKAGGAYVPIDPGYPEDRISFMLKDSKTPVLLTLQKLFTKFSEQKARLICLDTDWTLISKKCNENPISSVESKHLAYVIYTSGSTGTPKGVMISHQAICNHMLWMQDTFPLTEKDKVLQKTPFSFDASVWEFYAPLFVGGQLVIARPGGHQDIGYLTKVMLKNNITILQLVPSLLRLLLDERGLENYTTLKRLFSGGEVLPVELVKRFLQAQNATLCNLYGPTEATIDTSFWIAQPGLEQQTIPIGRPIANLKVYILDQSLQPVPVGVTGELHIGGVGLARGYLNQPELTQEKFIPNPFDDDSKSRLYKTGDLCRFLPDGNIEYLGRLDHQVKIRGFRIELGEIEALLHGHQAIREAVVIARAMPSSDKQLVAYLVLHQGQAISIPELIEFLGAQLPEYMIPAAFVTLDVLPLTPNGKVDRRALPEPDTTGFGRAKQLIAPRNSIEREIAETWKELLLEEEISVHDNFFELGGHSLLAMQCVAKLSKTLPQSLCVKDLFLFPTIAELAEHVAKKSTEFKESLPEPVPLLPEEKRKTPVEQVPSYLQFEHRPLLSLFTAGKLAPCEAAALDYLQTPFLEKIGLSRDDMIHEWCHDFPILYTMTESDWGRIAGFLLPQFDVDLYLRKEELINNIINVLEMAGRLGARSLSLTGLLPSATNYGRDIIDALAGCEDLPELTTGHETTCAAVVCNIGRILAQSGRNLTQERVGFLGLGSIGLSTLKLMLKSLPHPRQILLCDVYSKSAFLGNLRQELFGSFGFQGTVQVIVSRTEVPLEMYESTLIVGATNVGDILDITKLQAGTLIVDDSGPHCFSPELAIRRFEEQGDILFTEGGVLRSSHIFRDLLYLPRNIEKVFSREDAAGSIFLKSSPADIVSCLFSGLLTSRFDTLKPTIGQVDEDNAFYYYKTLDRLGFQGADLHCGSYVLPEKLVHNFRQHFS